MNIAIQQFSTIIFRCRSCRYESKLDLSECPGCGRVERGSPQTSVERRELIELQSQISAEIKFGTSAARVPAAETIADVYECEHCRYRTRQSVGECPDCGRQKFEKKSAAVKADGNFQENPVEAKHKPGSVPLNFGAISLLTAFEIFMGVQKTAFGNDYEKTAEIGEYWLFALIPAVVGVVFVAIGVHLKIKDFTK